MADSDAIADYIDSEVCCRLERGDDLGRIQGVSEKLLDSLTALGVVRGRTVLEVGCGAGGLCLALVRHGATGATGLDLSTQAIEAGRRSAADQGVDDTVSFRVADGAMVQLEPADLVVLDKVYCCYFDPAPLLANTLAAAGAAYAVVLPPSQGIRGFLAKVVTRGENAWHRLRGRAFRAHVHDVRVMERAVEEVGLSLRHSDTHWLWDLRIYTRAPSPSR